MTTLKKFAKNCLFLARTKPVNLMPLKSAKLKIPIEYLEVWENSITLIARLINLENIYVLTVNKENLEIIAKSRFFDNSLIIDKLKKRKEDLFDKILALNEPLIISADDNTSIKNLNKFLLNEYNSFIGIKLVDADDAFFGFLCAHDEKNRSFSELEVNSIKEIKVTIERDLKILKQNEEIDKETSRRKAIEDELRATNEELKTGLEKKYTEIDKISQDLKDIEEDYKLIVENQNALIVKFDKNFKLTYISPQYAKELGSNSNNLIGQSFFPFIHKDDVEQVKKSHENLKKEPYECSHEERMKTIHGWRWFFWSNKSIVNKSGDIEGIVAVGRDITKRKQFEQELRESEERYFYAMKGANDGLWDKNLITGEIYFSKRWKTMLGYQEHDLVNKSKTFRKLIHPDDYKKTEKAQNDYLFGKKAKYEVEIRLKHKKGFWVNVLSRGFKVMDEMGHKAIRFVGTHLDITELRKAETALKKSEAHFRKIIEMNSIPMVVTDNNQDMLMLNNAFTKCFGYTIEDIPTAESWWQKAYPDVKYRKQVQKEWNKAADEAMRLGTEIEKQIWEPTCKNGDKKIAEFAFVSLGKQNIITLVDITELKIAEQSFRESEEKSRALSEATEEALFFSDKGVCIECNKAACKMFAYKYEELIGINGTDVVAEESKELVKKNMMSGYEEPYEAIALKKDGTKFWAEFHGRMYNYRRKNVLVTAVRDITERKIAEEALIFSEAKFRAAFKTSPDSISINRLSDGRYIEINDGYTMVTGYSEKEAIGNRPSDLNLWVNDYEEKRFTDEIGQKDYCINLEAKFRLKSGRIVTGLISARTITLNQEKYIISITRDISKLKHTEEELIAAKDLAEVREKEYKKLFSEMLDGFALHKVIYDKSGVPVDYLFIDINPAYERLTGLKEDFVKDKTICEVAPNIEKHWIENFGKVGKTGEPFWFEDYAEEFGRYYNGLAYSPQQDYFAVIFNDVTDRKKAEKIVFENDKLLKEQNEEYQALNEELTSLNLELLEAKQKAEESDKLKTAFLANMSHEIRTPMNGIMGFSGLLAKDDLEKTKKQKYIEIIKQNSHQLLSIINDLVDISKIEAGQIDIEQDEVRLDFLTRSLADLYYQKAIDRGIKFQLENKSVEIEIVTDETKLRQILMNLLDNAFKFTLDGEIKFGYEIKDDLVEFFVIDTGIGIEKESLELIFERFRQVELSSARKYGGTGLGLSISKAYIEKMGGKIWVDSKIMEGSTFVFVLPLKFAKNNQEKPLNEFVDIDRIDWSDKVVLVAEDEAINYKFFEEILEETRVNLIWAVNGQEAVEHCMVNDSIDLVLMDLKMPVLNGYDATEQIKKLKPDLPIIAQTAYALIGDESKAIKAGCDDYIHKPINIDELMKKMARFLR